MTNNMPSYDKYKKARLQPGFKVNPSRHIASKSSRKTRCVWSQTLAKRAGALLLLLVCGFCYTAWFVNRLSQALPSIANLTAGRSPAVTTIVSRDGVILATFQAQDRRPVPLAKISPFLIDATLATEDARFYEHNGVDFHGIARAFWHNLLGGNAHGEGASTITQQLARNLYLTREKTFTRKLSEMLLARKIEQAHSKQEILEAYLNTIYYGEGCYGAEAAAWRFFGVPASKLTLGEAALLAGLPQRPSAFSPFAHRSAALQRRREVLARLVSTKRISSAQEASVLREPLVVRHLPVQTLLWKAPYFVSDVVKQLKQQFGADILYSGTRVETTLDWKMQRAAERALQSGVHDGNNGPNTGAIVSLDTRTGYVRALVGGADFRKDQFDAVTQGIRQPGSAFKPIVYATAFDRQTVSLISDFKDAPLVIPSAPKDYVVHNYDNGYRGTISVLEALEQSVNTVAVQVAQQTGPDVIAQYGQRCGVTTPLTPDLPLALGASGVHPLDLCSVYSLFANNGERYLPAFISRITDARGRELFADDPLMRRQTPFLRDTAVQQINVALREVVLHGTAQGAVWIPDAHGKTGTTNSHRDAWFVGYNRDLVTAVWVAHTKRVMARDSSGQLRALTRYLPMPGGTGGQLCVPIWRRFMASSASLQTKVNLAAGIALELVTAPNTKTLLAQLEAEQQRLQTADKASPQTDLENGNPVQASLAADQHALNGGPPMTVIAPVDADRDEYEAQDKDRSSEDSVESGESADTQGREKNDAQ